MKKKPTIQIASANFQRSFFHQAGQVTNSLTDGELKDVDILLGQETGIPKDHLNIKRLFPQNFVPFNNPAVKSGGQGCLLPSDKN